MPRRRLLLFSFIFSVCSFSFSQGIKETDWVIEPKFEYAEPFVKGLAIVKDSGKFGLIDETGKCIASPCYDIIRRSNDGYFTVAKSIGYKTFWGHLDEEGNIINDCIYKEVYDYSEGFAAYKDLFGYWGFMDNKGDIVIGAKYKRVSNFQDGVACVFGDYESDKEDYEKYIDYKGKIVCSEVSNKKLYKELKTRDLQKKKIIVEKEENALIEKIGTNGLWGYMRKGLNLYIYEHIQTWEVYLANNLFDIGTYEVYLKHHIEADINNWQQKGEFEPTLKWKERVNEESRKQKIDELTMNAIKHAFPDKTAPNKVIYKNITKLDNETGQLILKDNGVGIEDPSKITKNLGCEIIRNLTKQLDGHIELYQHENGTGYKLTFPLDMEHTIEG